MDKLNDLIGKRLNQHRLGESAQAALVLHLANKLLAEKFKTDQTEIKALRLKNGNLTIGTISSVWSQELWGYRDQLMEEIRKECGSKSVVTVVIQTMG